MIDTNALRKKVLDLAIRGKLVPQDPNDEPASVLLERIREEKKRLIREGKIKKDKVDSVIFRGDDNCHYEKIGKDIVCIEEELKEFDLPSSWAICRLITIADIYNGNSINDSDKKKYYTRLSDGHNYIGTKDIGFDHIIDYENGVKIPFNSDKFRIAYKDSPLLCIEGGSAGRKIAILEEDVCFGNKLCAFRSFGIVPKFLYYYLQSPLFVSVFKSKTTGLIGGVSINTIKELFFAIPPIEEQKRIVAYVDEVFKVIDLVEKNQNNYANLVEVLKSAILKSAIQGTLVEQDKDEEPGSILLERIREEKRKQLGKKYVENYIFKGDDNRYYEHIGDNDIDITEEIPYDLPNNWYFTRLNEYLDVRDGTHNSPKYCESGYPLVTSKNLSNGAIDFSTAKMISEKDYIAINERSFVGNNDILFAMIGSIGNPVLVKKDRDFAIKNMALFKQRTLIQNMEYMLYYFTYIQNSLRRKTSGALQPFISLNFFRNLIIPIPPLAEQERIVSKINETFAQL